MTDKPSREQLNKDKIPKRFKGVSQKNRNDRKER